MTPDLVILLAIHAAALTICVYIARSATKEAASEREGRLEAIEKRTKLYREVDEIRDKYITQLTRNVCLENEVTRLTNRAEVARASGSEAAALTPRAGAAEACDSGGKSRASRPRRR